MHGQLANAARVKYPAALQRCKLDTPLLAAGYLIPADNEPTQAAACGGIKKLRHLPYALAGAGGEDEARTKEYMEAKVKRRRWRRDDTELTLLALPTTIWYFLFSFLPMFGIVIAFKEFKINGGFLKSFFTSKWVGFNNFKFLFASKDIWLIIRNTLAYNIVLMPAAS